MTADKYLPPTINLPDWMLRKAVLNTAALNQHDPQSIPTILEALGLLPLAREMVRA